jgi:hypothetical protein
MMAIEVTVSLTRKRANINFEASTHSANIAYNQNAMNK